jgi:hypothetical protein
MVPRQLASTLLAAAQQYPIITLTGPRQSGKTTLCKALFPLPYVSLEPLDTRSFAQEDPRGFLRQYQHGAIFDEVQRVPSLLSYLQDTVDQNPQAGRFVLTGSEHFALNAAISQSLAGRTAIFHLLPLSWAELQGFDAPPSSLEAMLFQGGYPRIPAQKLDPARWLADYFATYVQRDVRSLSNITDLSTFTRFVRLCAGRTAQEVNLSALGADAGISHNTAKAWLSVLEASFLIVRLPPFYRNWNKQLLKSPKLHFVDTGLAAHLLGIQNPEQLITHPLKGALFESWVVSECLKKHYHAGLTPKLYHFREAKGLEIDVLIESPQHFTALECKSSETVHSDFFKNLERFGEWWDDPLPLHRQVVYGGELSQARSQGAICGWRGWASE